MNLQNIHLVLFLSRATPLQRWYQLGLFDRELAIYKKLRNFLGEITIVTAGGEEETKLLEQHQINTIKVLPNVKQYSPNSYSLMAPLIHHKALKTAHIYKTNQMDGAWTAIIAGKLQTKPVIVRAGYLWTEFVRQEGEKGIKIWLMNQLQTWSLHKATTITVTTSEMKEQIVQNYQISENYIQIVPNYVDTTYFYPFSTSKTPGRILYIGRLHPRKNLHTLLEAAALLKNIELQFIGVGPLEHELKEFALKLGIKLEILHNIPNTQLPQFINEADIFVMPSLFEGHPKALIEAMCCGATVLGSDVPGIHNVITHQQTGWLCQPTTSGLHEALTLLLNNPQLREKLGQTAAKFAYQHYSLDTIIDLEMMAIERTLQMYHE